MPTSRIQVTEGSGKNVATQSITEDGVTKDLQRIISTDSTGVEKGTSANPLIAQLKGSSSIGGGGNIFSNLSNDFIATPTEDTKDVVLSGYASNILSDVISGANFMVSVVSKRNTETGAVEPVPVTNLSMTGNTITFGDMANDFTDTDEVVIVLMGPNKAYDPEANVHFVYDMRLRAGEDTGGNVQSIALRTPNGPEFSSASFKDSGTVTKLNIKSSGGNLISIRITNKNQAADRWLQLHNKASAPAAGETAADYFLLKRATAEIPVQVDEFNTLHFNPTAYFSSGISIAISTTPTTFTDSATASDHSFSGKYGSS